MTRYLWLEFLRSVRDVRYLVLAIAMPVGLYLLFTMLFGSHGERVEGIPQTVELMVAMAVYGGMWAVFSATGPRIASERDLRWLRQLRVTPLKAWSLIVSKVIGAMAVALPAIILVCLTAVLVHGVRLPAGEWIALVAAVWLAMLPLTLIGFAIGYLVSGETASGVVTVLYFALGALGGLWMPVMLLPQVMQSLAHALPTNRIADLGWKIAAGQTPSAQSLLVLAGWTAAAGVLAVVSYRHAALA
jgi:ABC-2 type transport system permease protein